MIDTHIHISMYIYINLHVHVGNALSSAFLERMNALLASGEIPGLFEGDERLKLMSACRESYRCVFIIFMSFCSCLSKAESIYFM
jgi:hypothetical protein